MIKKRNSGHGDTLTPWRVSSNQDNNYKTNVPINATLISAAATTVTTVFLIFRFIGSQIYAVWFVASAVQMPLVLAFTIKHHKKTSKINPVVPRTLQFHEDENDCDFCDDYSIEENYERMDNDELPKLTLVEVYDHEDSTDHADENSDKTNENGDAEDNRECVELAVVNKQIKLPEIREPSSQLPGEVCHM